MLPAAFGAAEIALLEAAVPSALGSASASDGRRFDTSSDFVCHGAHLYSGVLRALSQHPAIVAPARRLLGGRDIYVHQSRVNCKRTKGKIVDCARCPCCCSCWRRVG